MVAGRCTTATICGTVGTGGVPGHADHERAVVAVIGWPPFLGVGHQSGKVTLDGGQIQLFESLGIVEAGLHRAGHGRVLVQDFQVKLVGPPVLGGSAAVQSAGSTAMHKGAFACVAGCFAVIDV